MEKPYDIVIIGGGFYGVRLALHLRSYFPRVLILEKDSQLLTRASYNNQARVHNGYHYPRSYITAMRSHQNYQLFITEYQQAIEDKFVHYYAIASKSSKVNVQQFKLFCQKIGAPLHSVDKHVKKLFNKYLIEDVFAVDEVAFNAAKLRNLLIDRLEQADVAIRYNSEVSNITKKNDQIILTTKDEYVVAGKYVYNCTYAGVNQVMRQSALPLLPLKHELTEMALIQMPTELKKIGITVMDGPFFSTVPFPDKRLHTLSHVRYTPHYSWADSIKDNLVQPSQQVTPQAIFMLRDASRYVPLLENALYKDSLFEVKTVLPQHEVDDGRPILLRSDHGMKNFSVVIGGKIDNIYDIMLLLDKKLKRNVIAKPGYISPVMSK